MAKRIARSAVALLLGAVALFSCWLDARGGQNAAQNPLPTVVRMDKTPHGIAYKVNSKPVGHTVATDILRTLSLVHDERGSDAPVVVLVDPNVTITDIRNFDGVAGKAQLKNIRFFVLNIDSGVMAELKWGPSLPISTNPN